MKRRTQTLARIPSATLEQFLLELANLRDDSLELEAEASRLEKNFAAFIPPPEHKSWCFDPARFEENEELSDAFPPTIQDRIIEKFGPRLWQLPSLRLFVCRLWIEPDARIREWAVFVLRYQLYTMERDRSLEGEFLDISPNSDTLPHIPPPRPLEQALSYLVKFADRARYCANPECPAPYFFVKRKNQRYCSEICAAPAQRELKRQWWAEHGEEWRAARQGKKSSKSKGKSKGESSKQKQTVKKSRKGGK
jgi:hypothetical protein